MRFPDWRERFHAELDAARDRPLAYGVHDCLQFPAKCVLAMTGVDPAAPFGEYSTELGAAKLMAQYGGIAGILTHAFGPAVAPNWARAGDIIVATIDGLETGGMCNGTNCAFVMIPGGLSFRPREVIQQAWRID
jgi:hypothetical protein